MTHFSPMENCPLDDIAWGNGKQRRQFTDDQVREIRRLRDVECMKLKEIAVIFKTSDTTVREICHRQRYGDIE